MSNSAFISALTTLTCWLPFRPPPTLQNIEAIFRKSLLNSTTESLHAGFMVIMNLVHSMSLVATVQPASYKSEDAIGIRSLDLSHGGRIDRILNRSRLRHRYWALNAPQWAAAQDMSVADLPGISADELAKLNKSSALDKTLAVIQVNYPVLNLIVRLRRNLPSAPSEIMALAYAACGIVTFLLYWRRPKGVESIFVIKAKKRLGKREMVTLACHGPVYSWLGHRGWGDFDPDSGPAPIPNDAFHPASDRTIASSRACPDGGDEMFKVIIGGILGGILFGCVHCLAWNFDFSTPSVQAA